MHDTSATEVGMYIGLGNALGGLIGVTLGGILGDKFKARHGSGRLIIVDDLHGFSDDGLYFEFCSSPVQRLLAGYTADYGRRSGIAAHAGGCRRILHSGEYHDWLSHGTFYDGSTV